MTSGMRICVIALICLTMSARGLSAGMSTKVAHFLAIMDGRFDNRVQYQQDNKTFDYLQYRCVPVTMPALPGRNLFFLEWSINGVVHNLYVGDVTENNNGGIHVTIYNFTDTKPYKPGQFNVKDLFKVKPEKLQTLPGCEAEYQLDGPDTYVGPWPECRLYVDGKPLNYMTLLKCDIIEVIPPPISLEKRPDVAYNLQLLGNRYKIPNAPENFVNPCN